MTRDEIYQRFGPILIEALCDIITDELNTLRAEHGLSPRTKQQLLNALESKLDGLETYDWIRLTDTGRAVIVSHGGIGASSDTNGWIVRFHEGGELQFVYRHSAANVIAMYRTWTPTAATWYHVAAVRTGNAMKLFVAGSQLAGDEDVTGDDICQSTDFLQIGSNWQETTGSFLNGHVAMFRISKGIARWTANFTPPPYPYHTIAKSQSF